MEKDIFDEMAAKWPSAVVSRTKIGVFTGQLVGPGHMANCDSQGRGPKERIKLGRNVGYPVCSLIEWLRSQSSIIRMGA